MAAAVPARLRPDGEAELMDAIREAERAFMLRLGPLLVAHGIAKHTFWPLWHLRRESEQYAGDLARLMGITAAGCTAIVDQLVDAGYVVRRPVASDRRHVLLAVTPKGRRTVDGLWRAFDADIAPALASLPTADVRVTARTLRAISDRLAAERAAASAEELR
jgi:DNA-binding MarR family transcriptional regulator